MSSSVLEWFKWASLASQRSRYHLKIAVALIAVIPLLSFCLLGLSLLTSMVNYSPMAHIAIAVTGLICGISGYSMLRQYPANIERMRHYLSRIASDDLPDEASLVHGEQDSSDIEHYLNVVIRGLHDKITRLDRELARSQDLLLTVESQSEEIVAAERQRVMIESLGAACHHLGQPATVLSIYLSRLQEMRPEVLGQDEFQACSSAVDSISEILKKLKRVSEYRTLPYITHTEGQGDAARLDAQIVDIEPAE
ncbi:MAG: hypothetical protein HN341_14565 [Verrucomicrobia bacterium]|nr:hypothetical protein [Verrucomicrobiota bacterium]